MSKQDRTRVARILSPTAPSLRGYLNRGVISATLDNSEADRERRDLAKKISYSIVRYTFSLANRRAINSQSRRASEVDIPRRGRLSCFSLTSRGNASKRRESRRVIPGDAKKLFRLRVGSIGTKRRVVVGLIKGAEIDGESLFNAEARGVNR